MLPVRSGIKTAIDGVVFTDFPATKKESSAKIQGQNTIDRLFRQQDIIHKKLVPEGQTINAACYQAVLNGLLQRIRRVWPEFHRSGKWMLLHDNAPTHISIRVRQFLAQKMVPVLDNPPYCPDLPPADFFLFPRLKAAIRGERIADVNDIKDGVTAVLRSIPQKAFADCFRKLYERCQTCVVKDGDYFVIGFTELFRHTLYIIFTAITLSFDF